jgi:ribonuclease HI
MKIESNSFDKDILIGYVDGASRGNPGPAAAAGIIYDVNGNELERFALNIGTATNNAAEYAAVIEFLKRARRYGAKRVVIKSDSELVIRQLKGEYSVRDEGLQEHYRKVKELAEAFSQVEYVHIRREENKEADKLCNLSLDSSTATRQRVRGKFTVAVSMKFDCAHKLKDYTGKCGFLHGHTYRVQVFVEGTQLKNGILIDIVDLKNSLREVLGSLDHKYLNELEFFREVSPTAENIAIFIAGELNAKLPPNVRLRKVKIFESEDSEITYELP